jgi:hypothetical protein
MMSHCHFLIILEQAVHHSVDSKTRRMWKWKLVNGSKWRSFIPTSTAFLIQIK